MGVKKKFVCCCLHHLVVKVLLTYFILIFKSISYRHPKSIFMFSDSSLMFIFLPQLIQ
jgi:hypothetical protein